MNTVGIICEYNPFHNGHKSQIDQIRNRFGQDSVIVCLMSGNYVQRGAPAIFDKSVRAEAALRCGADLVLEMPIPAALSSAENFAAEGVRILSGCCDTLCFGTETQTQDDLFSIADALLSPNFSDALQLALSTGCSFPSARQIALQQMGIADDLHNPNDILAVEYCKAILSQNAPLSVFAIHRPGSYHSKKVDIAYPSATAVRCQIINDQPWYGAVPDKVYALFHSQPVHSLEAGERAILSKLRTMEDSEFEALPFASEGLGRKLMKASRTYASLEEIKVHTKSKRYTRTRIDRMVMCAFLGINSKMINIKPNFVRVLGFSESGRKILHQHPEFRNAGETIADSYWDLEQKCGSLYGIFSHVLPEAPGVERCRRIVYLKEME